MEQFVNQILTSPTSNPFKAVMDHHGNIKTLHQEHFPEFVNLSFRDLQQFVHFNHKLFVILSNVQCVVKDLLLSSKIASRIPIKKFKYIQSLFVYGAKEPFKSKLPKHSKSERIAKMRFIHDVLQVRRFVCFEVRNFTQESIAWSAVCHSSKAELIPINDWSLASKDALVRFALTVQQCAFHKQILFCHCVAGLGRTGQCLLFIFMLHFKIYNIVTLLIKLADLYNHKAAIEIITMVERNSIDLKEMYRRFMKSYRALKPHILPDCIFEIVNHIPQTDLGNTFTRHQLKLLAQHGLFAKPNEETKY